MPAALASVLLPAALVVLFAGGLEKARITGDAVIVDVLPVRHVRHLRVAADTEGTVRALIDELDFDLVILQLRLTEAGAEQLCGDVDVRLAKLRPWEIPAWKKIADAEIFRLFLSNHFPD